MTKMHAWLLAAAVLLFVSGCGSKEFAPVEGVVKINGEAVEGAEISFMPVGEGSSAFGRTDASGHYKLRYTGGNDGAKIGENKVSISTYVAANIDDDGTVYSEGVPERFPPEYNDKTDVVREVVAGKNVFDFDVETDRDSYPRRPSGD